MNRMRIDKFLSHAGFGSRNDVRKLIKNGVVKINDEIVKSPDLKIEEERDIIKVFDQIVILNKFIYIMMNKPKGFICSNDDAFSSTVFNLLPQKLRVNKIHTVGRLDKDTEGLLILTNDGDFTHKVISPKKMIEKEYLVVLKNKIDERMLKKFEEGIVLDDGYKTLPAKWTILDDWTVLLIIHEGKYHQVKRMFEQINNEVVFLKRIRIGGLKLDEKLKSGEFKVMSREQAFLVFE